MSESELSRDEQETLGHKLFPAVDLLLRAGGHISPNGTEDEYYFLAGHRSGLSNWYRRYGYSLIFNENAYAYLAPQGGLSTGSPLSISDMVAGQSLLVMMLDPKCLQIDGTYLLSDFYLKVEQILGEDGMYRLVDKRRSAVKEKLLRQVKERMDQSLRRLARLHFISLDRKGERIIIYRSIQRFGEQVSAMTYDPEEAIKQMIEFGKLVWLGEEPDEEAEEIDEDGFAAEAVDDEGGI